MYSPQLTAGHTDIVWEPTMQISVNTPTTVSLRGTGDDDNSYLDAKLRFEYKPLDYYFSIGKLSRLPN